MLHQPQGLRDQLAGQPQAGRRGAVAPDEERRLDAGRCGGATRGPPCYFPFRRFSLIRRTRTFIGAENQEPVIYKIIPRPPRRWRGRRSCAGSWIATAANALQRRENLRVDLGSTSPRCLWRRTARVMTRTAETGNAGFTWRHVGCGVTHFHASDYLIYIAQVYSSNKY